nr:Chain D, T5 SIALOGLYCOPEPTIDE OF GLYCOPHORIN A [unidentified]2CWG_E Chain E, T5 SIALOGLYCOPEPTIDE OF GLYCOPHORIN A [unidentified]
DTYAATPR